MHKYYRFSCLFALLPMVLSTAGCANLPYQEYTGPDAAHIRMVAKDGSIQVFPENDCNGGSSVAFKDGFSLFNVAEYSVKPQQIVNVGFHGRRNNCVSGVSFHAAASTQYEIVQDQCGFSVNAMDTTNGLATKQPVNNLQPLICKK